MEGKTCRDCGLLHLHEKIRIPLSEPELLIDKENRRDSHHAGSTENFIYFLVCLRLKAGIFCAQVSVGTSAASASANRA